MPSKFSIMKHPAFQKTDNILRACRGDLSTLNSYELQPVKEVSLPLITIPPK